jgi:hypothetical protein
LKKQWGKITSMNNVSIGTPANLILAHRTIPLSASLLKAVVKMPGPIAGILLLFLFASPAQAQARWELNHGSQGYVPSLAAHLTPMRPLEATNRLRLSIGLPLHNQPQLDATLQALTDPANSQYHRWLTPEQFKSRAGAGERGGSGY